MKTVGADSPAGQRLATMHDFYTYVMREFPELIDRWHAERQPGTQQSVVRQCDSDES